MSCFDRMDLFYSTRSNSESIAGKIMGEGVEIIGNRNEPHIVKGKTAALGLKKGLIIDTEADDLAAFCLKDIWRLDVGFKRNICFLKVLHSKAIWSLNSTGWLQESSCFRGYSFGQSIPRRISTNVFKIETSE